MSSPSPLIGFQVSRDRKTVGAGIARRILHLPAIVTGLEFEAAFGDGCGHAQRCAAARRRRQRWQAQRQDRVAGRGALQGVRSCQARPEDGGTGADAAVVVDHPEAAHQRMPSRLQLASSGPGRSPGGAPEPGQGSRRLLRPVRPTSWPPEVLNGSVPSTGRCCLRMKAGRLALAAEAEALESAGS